MPTHPPAAYRLIQAVTAWRDTYPSAEVCVGLSGGADSLALIYAAAAVYGASQVQALIVDHQLQHDSATVADRAAAAAAELGVTAEILPVTVPQQSPGGLEDAARSSRYTALSAAAAGRHLLVGHTLDDQAETVLLGLGRGSGLRSLAGMAEYDPQRRLGRPFLTLRRADTVAACTELGLTPWQDPHNADLRFRRVAVRTQLLPAMEDILGGGVIPALGRTAAQAREDADYLDACAEAAAGELEEHLALSVVSAAAPALQRRIIKLWLAHHGIDAVTATHLGALQRLVQQPRRGVRVALPAHGWQLQPGQRLTAWVDGGYLHLGGQPVVP